ncbi:MAG TPA: DUF1659 domain-containing protein [Defluviitaleaceae bacterium]|nr:DUF1659 domain-containing protein [Candidatus Epulonipiscium sp.]HQD51214.1 DUF1659 domain-containing protein [Defluviitaleaceae bacterium]
MALVANVVGTKLSLKFQDGDKTISKTYGNIKADATDQAVFDVARNIAYLSDKTVEVVKKVVETELAEV